MTKKQLLALEVLEGAGGHGDYCRTQCPFCEDRLGSTTNHKNFWVGRETGFFSCWRCGIKGRLHGFEDDDQYIPAPREATEPQAPQAPHVDLGPPVNYVSAVTRSPTVSVAVKYLRSRGVTRSIAEDAKIGVCLSGPQEGRVVIPVLGIDNRTWLGWSARLYRQPRWDGEGKYQTCPGMDKGHVLFNLRALASTMQEPVLCCEGVFDAIQYFPHCVAFLGKPGDGHVDLLLASKRPIAICLDGDAHREAEALARRLRRLGRQNVGWVRLPARMDPNTVDPVRLRTVAADSVKDGCAEY